MVDHIIPFGRYKEFKDLTMDDLMMYVNVQPLWCTENRTKSDNLVSKTRLNIVYHEIIRIKMESAVECEQDTSSDDFDEIPDVDLETYSNYFLNIQCGRASEQEKLIVLKYYFMNELIKDSKNKDHEILKGVWNGFLSNKQRMIEKFCM